MGNAGSKVCESEKFEQHQQGFARASEACSQKRPRSPVSDLFQDVPPRAKRIRPTDNQIEEVRKDLERRFNALRSQAGTQTAQSVETHKKAVEDGPSRTGLDLEEQPPSPSSCATFGHSEIGRIPDEGSDDSISWVADSRSPSPELLAVQVDDGVGYGWSIRNMNADLAELSNTLLLTNDWPDYATAFRKSGKQKATDTYSDNEQLKRNKLGIKLTNTALSHIHLEPDTNNTGTLTLEPRANRAFNVVDTSLHSPHSDRVENAFGELDTARDIGGRSRHEALGASKYLVGLGSQRAIDGLWQRSGSQSPPFPKSDHNWSLNEKTGWQTTWEPLRSQRSRLCN